MRQPQEHCNPSRMKIKVKPLLKPRIISACNPLKQLLYAEQNSLNSDQDLQTVLQQIQINRQLVNQITQLDEQIEEMQLTIADLQNDYRFAEDVEDNSFFQDLSVPDETQQKNGLFFGQQKMHNQLLPNLKCILVNSKSISLKQILGSQSKNVALFQKGGKIQRTHPCSPAPTKSLRSDKT